MKLLTILAAIILSGSYTYAADDDYHHFFAISSTGNEDLLNFKNYRPSWSGGHSVFGTKKSGKLSHCYQIDRKFLCQEIPNGVSQVVYHMTPDSGNYYNRAQKLFMKSSKKKEGFIYSFICKKGCQQGNYHFMFLVSNAE